MNMLQEMLWNPVAAVESGLPAVNIRKNQEVFEVTVSVPGYDANRLEMTWEDKVLNIHGVAATPDRDSDGWYYLRREIRTPGFHYRVELPTGANESEIAAELKDGLLTIRVPMMPKRTIPIQIDTHQASITDAAHSSE